MSIPPVNPAYRRSLADYVLKADGKVYQSDGTTVVFDTSSGNSWPQNNGGWKLSGDKWDWNGNQVDTMANSVFYVEGNVKVASNPGSPGSPWQVTLIAEGYIDISGNPTMQANTDDLLPERHWRRHSTVGTAGRLPLAMPRLSASSIQMGRRTGPVELTRAAGSLGIYLETWGCRSG